MRPGSVRRPQRWESVWLPADVGCRSLVAGLTDAGAILTAASSDLVRRRSSQHPEQAAQDDPRDSYVQAG
jgi:hypothetical protein